MKRKKQITLGALFIILLGFFVFLHPVNYQKGVTVCSLEGENLYVEFDVTLYRYPWRFHEMSGQIKVGDKEYISVSDLYKNNLTNSFMFQVPQDYALNVEDTIILDLYKDRFDCFVFFVVNSGEVKEYYGPADSKEEVEKILLKINPDYIPISSMEEK